MGAGLGLFQFLHRAASSVSSTATTVVAIEENNIFIFLCWHSRLTIFWSHDHDQ